MKPSLKSSLTLILAVVLSLLVILYVFGKIDWTTVKATLAHADRGWLILALLVYMLNYILRGVRLQVLLPAIRVPLSELSALNGLYGMYNYLLPMKTGEISYVVLLNKRLKVPLIDSTASLLVQRLMDFVAVALLLTAVLIFYITVLPAWLVYASLVFCVGVLFSIAGLYWMVRRGEKITERLPWQKTRLASWLGRLITSLQNGFIDIYRRRQLTRLLLLTIAIWLCINTNFFLIVLSLGYRLSYFQVIVISTIMIPVTLLPVQGLANLGSHEFGWVAALSIFGQPESVALNIAFSSHIIILLFVLFLGASSFTVMLIRQFTAHPLES